MLPESCGEGHLIFHGSRNLPRILREISCGHFSEQLPCRSAEVKFFSVFLCQRCREIWREIFRATFSRVWVCDGKFHQNFTSKTVMKNGKFHANFTLLGRSADTFPGNRRTKIGKCFSPDFRHVFRSCRRNISPGFRSRRFFSITKQNNFNYAHVPRKRVSLRTFRDLQGHPSWTYPFGSKPPPEHLPPEPALTQS